jgi:hypothetical protein
MIDEFLIDMFNVLRNPRLGFVDGLRSGLVVLAHFRRLPSLVNELHVASLIQVTDTFVQVGWKGHTNTFETHHPIECRDYLSSLPNKHSNGYRNVV